MAAPALGRNNIIPGLDCFHFLNDEVVAFNGTLSIRVALPEPFPITGAIPGAQFVKLLGAAGEELELESLNDEVLRVTVGRWATKFPIKNVDSAYLAGLAEQHETYIELPTSTYFGAGLKRCSASMGGKGLSLAGC